MKVLYFSKAELVTKRLVASPDLYPLPLSSRLDKISALAISDTILDKTEKCMTEDLSE